MATRKKGLGRGLEALLGPTVTDGDTTNHSTDENPSALPLSRLVAGQYQPRSHMDEGALYELAESIKAQGIMQPILVRPLSKQQAQQCRKQAAEQKKNTPNSAAIDLAPQGTLYEIIAGERRFRAAHIAGLQEVPVLIKDVSDQAAAAMALIENIQREDLNPLEEAHGIQRLIGEFGLTHEQAAQAVGRSRSAASNLLRLLNLADSVQTMLKAGDIDMGHARALLALDKTEQITAANQISAKKMSVREAENFVKRLQNGSDSNKKTPKAKDPEIRSVEEELSDLLTAQVEVRIKKQTKKRGKLETTGELAIQFGSLDALNGVIARLRGETST